MSTTQTEGSEPAGIANSKTRRMSFYIVALSSLAFVALVFGDTLLLLALGWTAPVADALGTHRLHVMGIAGLLGTISIGFASQLYRPEARSAPLLVVVFTTLLTAVVLAVIGSEFFQMVLALFVFAGVLGVLHPSGSDVLRFGERYSPVLMGLVAAAAVPLVLFAVDQFVLQATAADEHALDGHYAMMGVVAVTVLGGGLVAALGFAGYRVAAWMVGLLTLYLGALSVAFPDQTGSVGLLWGTLAVVWGVAFIAAAELSRRDGAPSVLSRPFSGDTGA